MLQSPSPLVPMTTEPHYIINYNYKNIFMIADLANIKAHRYSLIVQSAIIMTALLDSVYCKFNRRLKSFNERLASSPIDASSYGKCLYGMLNI